MEDFSSWSKNVQRDHRWLLLSLLKWTGQIFKMPPQTTCPDGRVLDLTMKSQGLFCGRASAALWANQVMMHVIPGEGYWSEGERWEQSGGRQHKEKGHLCFLNASQETFIRNKKSVIHCLRSLSECTQQHVHTHVRTIKMYIHISHRLGDSMWHCHRRTISW